MDDISETNITIAIGFIAIFGVIFGLLAITGFIPLSLGGEALTADAAAGGMVDAEIIDLKAGGAVLGSEAYISAIIKNSGARVADFSVEFEALKENRVILSKSEKLRNIQRSRQVTLVEEWVPRQAGTYSITVRVKSGNALAVYDIKTVQVTIK